MIWLIGYLAVALVAWVFTARYLHALDQRHGVVDRWSRGFAFATAGFAATLWPLAALALVMWHVTFRPRRPTDGEDTP